MQSGIIDGIPRYHTEVSPVSDGRYSNCTADQVVLWLCEHMRRDKTAVRLYTAQHRQRASTLVDCRHQLSAVNDEVYINLNTTTSIGLL